MSRSQTWWTIAFAAIVLALLGWLFWPTPEITNFPTSKRGPIVFVGDSLVSGVGASEGKSLPTQLSRLLGEPVLNYGVAGDTTRDGLARLAEPVAAQPRLALILLGGNDFLRRVERSQIEANLEQIVRSFQREGAIVLLLGVRSGIFGGGADELFESVAERTGAAYEEDVLKGIFGDQALMSDTIHPNDAGYKKIAERLLSTVQELLGK